MPEHTPTPWKVRPVNRDVVEVESGEGLTIIGMMYDSPQADKEANAAYIVTAVNAYEKHRELLERAMRLAINGGHNAKLAEEIQDALEEK